MDLLSPGALALTAAEWLAIGWLSGVGWPAPTPWGPRWALRLLVGVALSGMSLLLLAVLGVAFRGVPLPLAVAVGGAGLVRWLNHLGRGRAPAYAPGVTPSVTRSVTAGPEASSECHNVGGQPAGVTRSVTPGVTGSVTAVTSSVTGTVTPTASQATVTPSAVTTTSAMAARASVTAGVTAMSGSVTGSLRAAAATFAGNIRREQLGTGAAGGPRGRPWTALWALLALVLLAAAVRALLVPEAGWDAYSHWGLKAQAYFQSGGIVDTHSAHEYYPPLVPLVESWLYLQRGAALIDLGKDVWALLGAAFVICLAWQLRLALPRHGWVAPLLALGVLLGTTQLLDSFWTGEADLALAAYLSLATLALLRWQQEPNRAWLVQAVLFAAAAGLTKYEGIVRVGVLVVAVVVEAVLRRRSAAAGGALAVGLAAGVAYAPWAVFRALHGIEITSEHVSRFQPEAVGAVLVALGGALGGVRAGGGVVVAILAGVVAGRRAVTGPLRLLTLATLGQLAATLIAFLITDYSPVLQVRLSATRLFEQLLPVALFAAAVWLTEAVGDGQDAVRE